MRVDAVAPLVDEIGADPVGNLLARVGGSGPRTLVLAHMDEIGFVVTHVTDEGFLFVANAQSSPRLAAERAGIPFQHGTFGDYGSDGSAFQGAGSPAALVTAPVRYTHTAIEMAAIADVRATVELLRSYVV